MKHLVTLCFFITFSVFSFSQDCSGSSWFKPGTTLEYRTFYEKKYFGGGSGTFEVTRLTFTVIRIVDSVGKKWACITKKGKALKSEMGYEKEIAAVCDNGFLGFDATHFTPDTIYNSDVPPVFRGKNFSMALTSKGDKFYPFSASKTVGNIQQVRSHITQPMFGTAPTSRDHEIVGKKTEEEFESKIKITKLEVLGEEEIQCEAGKFKCTKVAITSEITLGSLGTQSMTGIFYCNKEFGVIKATSPTASYELSKITP